MSKIIKPLLNEDGTQVVRELQEGEYYYDTEDYKYIYWNLKSSNAKFAIYYAEEWRPEENEIYWYFSFDDNTAYSTNYNPEFSGLDRQRILIGNFFESEEQANNNIIKVLDNMKKYYEEKLKGGADETLHI